MSHLTPIPALVGFYAALIGVVFLVVLVVDTCTGRIP